MRCHTVLDHLSTQRRAGEWFGRGAAIGGSRHIGAILLPVRCSSGGDRLVRSAQVCIAGETSTAAAILAIPAIPLTLTWSKYARGVATPKEVGSEELATVQYSPLATLMLFRDSKMLLLIAIIAYNGFSYVVDQCCCAREHERDREVRDIYRLFTYSLWCSGLACNATHTHTHAQASVLLWRLPTTVWISPDRMGLDVVFVVQHDRYVAVGRLCHSEVD